MTWYMTTSEEAPPLRDAMYDWGYTVANALVETFVATREVARAALRRP